MTYEIGVVYKKNNKYFISINEETLVTYNKGKFVTRRPVTHYDAIREMAVDTLAKMWKTDVDTIDNMSREYFCPTECSDSRPTLRRKRGPSINGSFFDMAHKIWAQDLNRQVR